MFREGESTGGFWLCLCARAGGEVPVDAELKQWSEDWDAAGDNILHGGFHSANWVFQPPGQRLSLSHCRQCGRARAVRQTVLAKGRNDYYMVRRLG